MRTSLFLLPPTRHALPIDSCLLGIVIPSYRDAAKGLLISDRLTYGRWIPWRTNKRETKRGSLITLDLRVIPAIQLRCSNG